MAIFKKVKKEKKETKEVKTEKGISTVNPKTVESESFCQPHLTEKSTELKEIGKYTFLISANMNKIQVKQYIQKFYNTKVANVNISHKFFAPTKFRGKETTKSPVKKAIVTLVPGQKIEFNV